MMHRYYDPIRIARLLALLLTGEATESQRRELASLIEKHGLDRTEILEGIIKPQTEPDISEKEAEQRILASLRVKIRSRRAPLRRRATRYAAAVAALILIAAGSFIASRLYSPGVQTIAPPANLTVLEYPTGATEVVAGNTDVAAIVHLPAPQTTNGTAEAEDIYKIRVPRGASHTVTLDDGTTVCLYPGSELRFPAVFGPSSRSVELSGEGYFEVAHDQDRPFTVKAGGVSVKVVGTSFNIRAYEGEPTVETALVQGSVAVNDIMLTPDHKAVFHRSDGRLTIAETDGGAYMARAGGNFVFDNRTLDEIMIELSLWFDFDYDYADEALKQKSFRFRMPRTEDFGRLTSLIKLTGEVEFRVTGRHVAILPGK